jgi:aldehyde dehydrogenase (NAD+)
VIEKRQFYINGCWVDPAFSNDLEVIDPSTEEPCAVISQSSPADVDRAVSAAREAFPGWAATSPARRKGYVEAILAQFRARRGEMAKAISMEMGAPIDLAMSAQTGALEWHLENFLNAVDKVEWLKPFDGAGDTMIAQEPIGVVGLITPWNWPMNQVTLKVIPALLAGCTCVLKPSEIAPLSSLLFAEFVHDAGVPAGVFNLVNGDGAITGAHLSSHPDVEMISFTGSTRAGRAISKAAADTLKKVTLELGGKGANLVFGDADKSAVERGVLHMMRNSGQSCNAPSRMLVERSVYDQAVEMAAQVASSVAVAPAAQTGDHIGLVVSKRQWDQIQSYIQSGIDEGARLVTGGLGLPEGVNRGYFVRPTVFADVRPGMTIERQEIFGPVLTMMPFDSEEEAITIANDTPYGLTNYLQTQDADRIRRLSLKLKAGMIEVNGQGLAAGVFFGGIKDSGRAREGGVWGIEEFLESKAMSGWKKSA